MFLVVLRSFGGVVLLLTVPLDVLQFEDLQECYLQKRRRKVAFQRQKMLKDSSLKVDDLCMDRSGLEDFQSVLTAFTRYRSQSHILRRFTLIRLRMNLTNSVSFRV